MAFVLGAPATIVGGRRVAGTPRLARPAPVRRVVVTRAESIGDKAKDAAGTAKGAVKDAAGAVKGAAKDAKGAAKDLAGKA